MNKQEAIQALKDGKVLTHRFFTPEEHVSSNTSGTEYTFEDGVKCNSKLFWQDRQGEYWENDWGECNILSLATI